MGRPRGFSEDEVLQAAMRLFWQRGYRATTMAELVAATGVQRGSLYRIFGNKAAIFEAVLARYSRWRIGRLDLSAPPRSQIRQWLSACAEDARADDLPRGCLLVLASTEAAALEPPLQALVQSHLDGLERFFAQGVASAAPKADAEALGTALMAANIGLFMMSYAGATPARLSVIVDRIMRLIPEG